MPAPRGPRAARWTPAGDASAATKSIHCGFVRKPLSLTPTLRGDAHEAPSFRSRRRHPVLCRRARRLRRLVELVEQLVGAEREPGHDARRPDQPDLAPTCPATPRAPIRSRPATRRAARQLAACAGGVTPSKEIVDINSPKFSAGSGLTSADELQRGGAAELRRRPAEPQGAHLGQGPHLPEHVAEHRAEQVQQPGVTFNSGTITTLPTPRPAPTADSASASSSARSAQGVHIPFYLDVFGFAKNSTRSSSRRSGSASRSRPRRRPTCISLLVEPRRRARALLVGGCGTRAGRHARPAPRPSPQPSPVPHV